MTIDQLATAYELRVSGLCWKKVAAQFGVDSLWLARKVRHLCNVGIKKGRDGFARIPGRRFVYDLQTLRRADVMRGLCMTWGEVAEALGADQEALRRSWRYANNKNLIWREEDMELHA